MKYLALAAFLPLFALAEAAPRTLNEYFDGRSVAGDVVCEPAGGVCYLEVGPAPVLTKAQDPTGDLRAGGETLGSHLQFTRVEIAHILGELERGRVKASGAIDVFVKINWTAETAMAGREFGDHNIVHGKLWIEEGRVTFTVSDVKDRLMIGMYQPNVQLADVFRLPVSDVTQIKNAHYVWLESLLAKVLPAALGLTPAVAPKP